MGMIPGVTGRASAPCTYTMTYLNGPQTYTETFALLDVSASYVASIEGGIQPVFDALSAALATVPYVGAALAALVQFGVSWYEHAAANQDGSITFQFAHHYAGTKAGGIDVTAWPIPGVPELAWNTAVDGLLMGIRSGVMNPEPKPNAVKAMALEPASVPRNLPPQQGNHK